MKMKLRYPFALALVVALFGTTACQTLKDQMKSPRPDTQQYEMADFTQSKIANVDVYRVVYNDGRECFMQFAPKAVTPVMNCNWKVVTTKGG